MFAVMLLFIRSKSILITTLYSVNPKRHYTV